MKKLFIRIVAKSLSYFGVKRRSVFEFFNDDQFSKPALNDLDDKLSKYFNFKKGIFLEVGANDGFKQSNTYYLEKILNWNGILIEGIPDLYKECLRNRSGKNYIVNCALVSDKYSGDTIEMQYADLMSTTRGAFGSELIEKEHIKTGLGIQNITKTYSVEVPAMTLTEVLKSVPEKFKEIDLLSLDVEGFELEVLKGFDLDLFAPKYILVETSEIDIVEKKLSQRYNMIDKLTHHDYLFQLKI